MKIDAQSFSSSALLKSAASGAHTAGAFATTLAAAGTLSRHDVAVKPAEAALKAKTPQEELADYLKKSPAQHMRDAILKEMGLTDADVAAMSPEKRAALEDTLADKIKEKLLSSKGNAQSAGQALLAMVAFASDAQKVLSDQA